MRHDNPDRNAKEILANLRLDGWVVARIRTADDNAPGVPDAMVCRLPTRKVHLLEVKRLGGKLNAAQIRFIQGWPGCVHVATNSWEAGLLLRECEIQ